MGGEQENGTRMTKPIKKTRACDLHRKPFSIREIARVVGDFVFFNIGGDYEMEYTLARKRESRLF